VIDAMSSVLITGSNDGLGRDAARRLVDGLVYLTSGLHEQGVCRPRGPRLDRAPVGREAGVRRLQALRRDARRGDGPAETGHRRDVRHTRLGGDEDGRRGRAGRPRGRSITQTWLAVSDDPEALHGGALPYHQAPRPAHPAVADEAFQDRLLDAFARLTGVPMP
jgi:hypothetical protein